MEPKIRIKGFKGDWEKCIVNDIANRHDNLRIPVKESERQKGYIPYYGANGIQDYVSGYTHDGAFVLVAEDGASDLEHYPVQYAEGKIWVNNHAHVLSAKGDNSTLFLKYLISEADIKSYLVGGSRAKLNAEALMHLTIVKPFIKEQQALGTYFHHLDSLIQSTTKKIESLKQVKAASLQSMFPREGKNMPRVRMGKRNDSWKECKLNSILIERHEVSTITQDLPQLSFTIAEGVIRPEDRKSNQRDFLIKDKDNKRYLITRVGDIIYNPANVVYGAIHRNSLIDGVVSPIYRIFSTNQDSRFMECVVRRPSFINQLAMRTEGTVTKLKTLKPEAFLDMTVSIPTDMEEQRKIGEYFKNLDTQINLHSQRLEKLKQIKSACLDNMLV